MTDSIVDDVQVLLDKELGDKRILSQILRAAQNNEVISNFERNYVIKLTEKYLRPKPSEEKTPEIPKPLAQNIETPSYVKPQSQLWSQPPKETKPNSKNNFKMIGVGILALAIIVIAGVSLSGDSDFTSNENGTFQPSGNSQTFSIVTDSPSYNKGDIISINGKSSVSFGNQINLSIENPKNVEVWSENVGVKSDGQFNTLTFAGGVGWENAGIFTIIAEIGSEKTMHTFSFSG